MKKKTVREQRLMLADLIEKGRSMLSERELTDFVPHVLLQLFSDQHAKQKLFVYHLGFALVAKLGSAKLAKKYLVRLFSEKRLMPHKTLGISESLARVLYKEFTPYNVSYNRSKFDAAPWIRAYVKKAKAKVS